MNTDNLRFKKYLKFRVEPKRCPTHNKSAHISVNGMDYKITYCCCEEFRKVVESRCNRYKYGIPLGKYGAFPKKRLK